MKRYKPFWAVVAAGACAVVVGALIGPSRLGRVSRNVSGVGAALAAMRLWLHQAATHVTTTQLIEAAVVAWVVFVLSLILLARSQPREPHVPPVDVLSAASTASMASMAGMASMPQLQQPEQVADVTDLTPYEAIPALPTRPAPGTPLVAPQDVPTRTQPARAASVSLSAAPVAIGATAERRVEFSHRSDPAVREHEGPAVNQSRTHTLALTGISSGRERTLRYGLFVVAEDTGPAQVGDEASHRVVKAIAEQMIPVLAGGRTVERVQLSVLLRLAVMRGEIELRQHSIRVDTDTDLDVALAGVLIVGNVAYIACVEACGVYLFRPADGLMRLTMDQGLVPASGGQARLAADALDARPRRVPVCTGMESKQWIGDVEVTELTLRPNDLLLLCSTELLRALSAPRIEAILRVASDLHAAAESLARGDAPSARKPEPGVIVLRPRGDSAIEFGVASGGA